MIVYKAINIINNKIYIGITTWSFNHRLSQHKTNVNDKSKTNYLYNSIRKYGWDNFKWEVIEQCETLDELKEKEMYWIKYYNSYIYFENSNGYNMSLGGEGAFGAVRTDEYKKQKSEATKRWYEENGVSKERRRKLSKAKEGYNGEKNHMYGRSREKSNSAKLSQKDVMEIIDLLKSRVFKGSQIAKIYNVSQSTISSIKNGKSTWIA